MSEENQIPPSPQAMPPPTTITAAAAKLEVDNHLDPMHRHLRKVWGRLYDLGFASDSLLVSQAKAAADAVFALECSFMDIAAGGKHARKALEKGGADSN
jgi:hypothetical protein